VVVGYMIFQLIPELVSSDDTQNFIIGLGLVLISVTVIVLRLIEICNEIKGKF
jgi:hypothetical protein